MSIIVEPTTVIVIQQPHSTVTVENQGSITVVQPNPTHIIVQPGIPEIVAIAEQGPPGPPGTGSTIIATAGTTIALGTVLISTGGKVYPADPTNLAHASIVVGIALQSKTLNENINIAQLGQITLSGIVQDAQYFVGLNGILSTDIIAPSALWFRYIGLGESDNTLLVASSSSVLLP